MLLLARFNVCKTSVEGSYFSKVVAGFFPADFTKIDTVTGIFQGSYLGFSNFLLYAIFPEDVPTADPVNFNMSRLNVSKAFCRSINIIPVSKPLSKPFKTF